MSNLRNVCDVLKEMKSDFIRLPDRKIGNRSYNIKINSRVGSPVEPHVEDASCCIDTNNIYYDLILYDSPLMKDRRNGVNRAGIPEKLPHRKYRTTVI